MKKILYFLLLALPAISWGQSSVTMQFRSISGQRYPIYTWGGIPGGDYDTLWNAAQIRSFVGGAYVHLTGNITETATGFKTFSRNIVVSANNQTYTVFSVDPTFNNPGGFTGTVSNATFPGVNILAASFRGQDGSIFGNAVTAMTTFGAAPTIRIQSTGPGSQTIFRGGQTTPNTEIRPYDSNNAILMAPDGGRVVIGGAGGAVATPGNVSLKGVHINQILQPQANGDTVSALYIGSSFGNGNKILTYDTLIGGTGNTNGSYTNVSILNQLTGSGVGGKASVTVSGGVVTVVTITNGGSNYNVGDVVNLDPAIIGGSLTASFRIATVGGYTGQINRPIKSIRVEPSEFAGPIRVATNAVNPDDVVTVKDLSGSSGTVTSITPGYGFTSATPITTTGTLIVDSSKFVTTSTAQNITGSKVFTSNQLFKGLSVKFDGTINIKPTASASGPTGYGGIYISSSATEKMQFFTPNNVFTIGNTGAAGFSLLANNASSRGYTLPDVDGTISLARSGSFSGSGTATTTFTVSIGVTQVSNTYRVNVSPTSALSAALFYINNKTTTTFDVVYLAGLTGTVTFDWAVFNN